MPTISEIIAYYVNLLIMQYYDKPKAQADIELFITQLFANNLVFQLERAFDLDTSVGNQLTILGKYVGIDRVVNGVVPERSYFNLVDGSIAPASNVLGFSDSSNYVYGYFYDSLAAQISVYTLTDSEMRTLIRLKILNNNITAGFKDIKETIYNSELDVDVTDSKNMSLTYITGLEVAAVLQIAIYYDLLPRPACCGRLVFSVKYPDTLFGARTYYRETSNVGFSTYATPRTATILSYSDII